MDSDARHAKYLVDGLASFSAPRPVRIYICTAFVSTMIHLPAFVLRTGCPVNTTRTNSGVEYATRSHYSSVYVEVAGNIVTVLRS